MKHRPLPPLEELKEFLDYNPHTGIFTWIKSMARRCKVGQVAGGKSVLGYFVISFNYKEYKAHRLAYYMYHNVDPSEKQIDHINGNRLDNRIKNLRLVTNQQNQFNRTSLNKSNTSGRTGVYWHKRQKKWQASIKTNSKMTFLGYYTKKEDAIQARIEAEKKYFGKFRRNSQIDCDFPK